MRRLLLALAAAVLAAPAARAQDVAISFSHARSLSMGNEAFGDDAQVTALRVEVPMRRVMPFGSVAVATEMEQPICLNDCGKTGDVYLVALGMDYRLREARPWIVVPYLGGGPELLMYTGGYRVLLPTAHVGGDLFFNDAAALRLELQMTGGHGAASAGVRLEL